MKQLALVVMICDVLMSLKTIVCDVIMDFCDLVMSCEKALPWCLTDLTICRDTECAALVFD